MITEEHLHQGSAPPCTAPSASWDRRRRNPGGEDATRSLEAAVRHLVFDQMKMDRVFSPGASDAVAILWAAIAAMQKEALTVQRTERLAAAWLPQHAVTRWQREQARADSFTEPRPQL